MLKPTKGFFLATAKEAEKSGIYLPESKNQKFNDLFVYKVCPLDKEELEKMFEGGVDEGDKVVIVPMRSVSGADIPYMRLPLEPNEPFLFEITQIAAVEKVKNTVKNTVKK